MEQIPAGTLVVVADGGSARIFRNVAEPPALSLVQIDLRRPGWSANSTAT